MKKKIFKGMTIGILISLISFIGNPASFNSTQTVKGVSNAKSLRKFVKRVKEVEEKNHTLLKDSITQSIVGEVNLPSKFDWRKKNGVTPIKNQGYGADSGNCWAFATIGILEINIKIQDKVTVDLSEQFLMSCNDEGYSNQGGQAVHKMHVNPGAVLEADCPYTKSNIHMIDNFKHPYKADSSGFVKNRVKAIKKVIKKYGAVYTTVTSDKFFRNYNGGIYDRDNTAEVNHAVILIGWDDSKGAWILRNSWGTDWGDKGYMYIKYGVSNIGSESSFIIYKDGISDAEASSTADKLQKYITSCAGKSKIKQLIDRKLSKTKYTLSTKNYKASNGCSIVRYNYEFADGSSIVMKYENSRAIKIFNADSLFFYMCKR